MNDPTELKSYSQRFSHQLHGQDEASEQRQHQQSQLLLNSEKMAVEMEMGPAERAFPSMAIDAGLHSRPRPMPVEIPPNDRAYSPARSTRSSDANTPTSVQWTPTTAATTAIAGLAVSHEASTPQAEAQGRRSRENFTPEQLAFLRQLYSNGVTRTSCHLEIQAAANQLNISYDRVKNWINNNNKRIRQLAAKERKRASSLSTDARSIGRTPSIASDRVSAAPGTSAAPASYPINSGGSSMMSPTNAARETMLMSSGDGAAPSSHDPLHHSDSNHHDDALSSSHNSPFSFSGLKRARTEPDERLSSRPSSQYAYEDIDLLVMHKEDVVGAFPVPTHATLIHVVQSCVETKKHVLLLASQLNEPAYMHLKHGVLIFLNTADDATAMLATGGSSIFARLEQTDHGRVRRLDHPAYANAGHSPMHYTPPSETCTRRQSQHQQQHSPLDAEHSPSDHFFDTRPRAASDAADMAAFMTNNSHNHNNL
ncbi:hypothetical protein SYNPS1DRAFT_28369 [Syncephalis pseudoplumigaleata]|uniref:Homeobox domain-containing protein n=1 Tax=Syncephalis pseudoplumigaleata TaxID=1712513 RepID=A0A4P9Z0U2_9FUNG|nr:hypothetical protein SYNPS1DRAFT_28369 [Syncephalis pseudoplumigaleata]|eukprot:RKP25918.1 hypothetical protein SYNPS1DRAFT_28369 [Syncephalis pseudoplumigaleata]